MFGSTSRSGFAAAASFQNARLKSALDAVGVRYPIELTHSTRLSRAISRIRCVFDSGSPFQSWLKQSMSLPRKESAATVAGAFLIATFTVAISLFNFCHRDTETQREEKGETEGRSSSSLNPHAYLSPLLSVPLSLCLCVSVAVYFAVDELARPHLEIDQRPEPLGMIASARLMFGDQVADERRIEDAAGATSRSERVIFNHWAIRPAKPSADRRRESHLGPRQDRFGQNAFHAPPQDVFGRRAAQLHP